MRRPLCYAAVSFAFETVIFRMLGVGTAALIMTICIAASVIVFRCIRRCGDEERRRAASLVLVVAAGMACSFLDMYSYTAQKQDIEDCITDINTLSGTVQQRFSKTSGSGKAYVQYKVRVSGINGQPCGRRFSVLINDYSENLPDETAIPGNHITAYGTCEKASGRRNPGCFDYYRYLEADGISAVMSGKISGCVKSRTLPGIMNEKLYLMKSCFNDEIKMKCGDETAGLINGIMFGETYMIQENVMETFRKNGTAHILAVSGIHIGMVYGFLSFLWRGKKGRLFFVTMSVFFVCYTVLADFSPSVVRAAAMVETHIFASVMHRRYDLDSAAFMTALVSMVIEPVRIFDTGFQMSYLAVLTLALILPYIHRVYTGILSAGIAVQLGLAPYMIYVFNSMPLLSVFINVPVIFLAGIIIPAGLVSAAAMIVCRPLVSLVMPLLSVLCKALIYLNEAVYIKGVTAIDVVSPDIRLVALFYIFLFLFMSETGRMLFIKKRKWIIMLCIIFTLAVSGLCGACFENKFKIADVVFVDVGQGDCMHLRTRSGSYLFDGGGKADSDIGRKVLKPYLLKNGVRKLKGAFVTHLHTDHYKGIAELCREGMVEKLYIYEGNRAREEKILQETGLCSEDIIYLHKGQSAVIDRYTEVDILWPEHMEQAGVCTDKTDENLISMIMRVRHKGRSILVTGDIDDKCHDRLAELYSSSLKSDILKVAHHGSRYSYSETFTEAASPEMAVFQVGRNNYGHPNGEVIDSYRRKGIKIFRNDLDGAVGLRWKNGGNIDTVTMIGNTR